MEDFVYFNNLYDLYNCLLKKKKKMYFEDYYFNNLSLSEMAESYKVSRNAIFKQLHIVTDKLKEYENKMGLFKKKNQLLKIIEKIKDENIKKEIEELI